MSGGVLDDVFELLSLANELENTSRIEAATKYYEAVYLMKMHLARGLPMVKGQEAVKNLLNEKIRHYENVATSLMNDDSSTMTKSTFLNNPRSPIMNQSSNFRFESRSNPKSVGEVAFNNPDSVILNRKASQANTKLSHALDLDEAGNTKEAVNVYMETAELYLSVLQVAEKLSSATGDKQIDQIAAIIKRRLTQTLDRVEELKKGEASKQNSIRSSRKNENENVSTLSQQTQLTAEEISILKKSSLIASGVFLPWSDSDSTLLLKETLHSIQNPPKSQSQLFTDPDGALPLSDKQKSRFHRWARPSEIAHIRQQSGMTRIRQTPVMVKSITPYSIKQQYVTDCSFVASLCICAAFERRFRKRLITSILHPQDERGNLLYNPAGKYMVKLWLNGVARCVVVDDYLPIDKYGNLLCSHSSITKIENKQQTQEANLELWVCIIEKAYMKLCGGYNFPGSNSGVDLFSLTGWIPERLMFAKDAKNVKDFETPPERAFERIFSASSFGDCLITVSTELQLSDAEADAIGLVTGHAYAVLDVIQTRNGTRLLQLKNPWANKGWKGRFSCRDKQSWRDPAFRSEVGYDPDLAMQQDDGVFWVCWEDILKYFQNFHLNWNPKLFKYRFVTHGFWPLSQGPKDDTFCVGENPQYILHVSKEAIKEKATIWILISRHVTKQEQAGVEAKDYLTVHLHRNKGKSEKIWYPGRSGNCILNGVYTNNPHVLVRYDIEGPEDEHLSIVLSQYNKSNDLGYTLSCYCTENFSLGKPKGDLEHSEEFSSAWTKSLSGGPVGRDTFRDNPMYAIKVPDGGAILQLTVATSTTAAVNVMLVPVKSFGDGIEKATAEPVIDSGNYRHGFTATERKKVRAGAYALIVSNFHIGETAVFKVKVASGTRLRIDKIQ